MNNKKIALVIPTYNAENHIREVLKCIFKNSNYVDKVKVFDSQSTDATIEIVKDLNVEYEILNKKNFSHSGTRTKIAKEFYQNKYDYLVFLTQDVYLKENAIREIVTFIEKNKLPMVYGRQVVDLEKGNLFELFSRLYNYPNISKIKSKDDISELGIKTIFSSDAFCIYDLKSIHEIGYFGCETNYAEDMIIAHNLIQTGYSIGYCAEAVAYHTHNYSIVQEFNRYKVTGNFHRENNNIIKQYGKVSSEGISLALSEIKFLVSRKKIHLIPESIVRNAAKFTGMKIGKIKR